MGVCLSISRLPTDGCAWNPSVFSALEWRSPTTVGAPLEEESDVLMRHRIGSLATAVAVIVTSSTGFTCDRHAEAAGVKDTEAVAANADKQMRHAVLRLHEECCRSQSRRAETEPQAVRRS